MAAADLVQQIRVLAAVHGASEHSIEPAVEVPGFLLELPAEGEVLGPRAAGSSGAAIGQGVQQRLAAAASALRSSAQFVRLALAMVRPDGIARDVVPQVPAVERLRQAAACSWHGSPIRPAGCSSAACLLSLGPCFCLQHRRWSRFLRHVRSCAGF